MVNKSNAIRLNVNFVPPPNYNEESKWSRLKRRLYAKFVAKIDKSSAKFKLYPSYWHYLLGKKQTSPAATPDSHFLFLKPNFGAGIGHQLANWNAALYFAGYFHLRFAHSPFSNRKWEFFLGFGEGEESATDLLQKGFKLVRLPKFNPTNQSEIDLVRAIISSYTSPNILFSLEVDQGYVSQFDTYRTLRTKYLSAAARKEDKLLYSPGDFNIAVHIRRRMSVETDTAWKERGLDNAYFATVLSRALEMIPVGKKVSIYLFSQGSAADFPEFSAFKNITFCLDMGPIESFLHMIHADLLISSKSSFSYKPALLSEKLKIVPKSFWHQYPATEDYILADNNGVFDRDQLLKGLAK
jgi:hypothetical protein